MNFGVEHFNARCDSKGSVSTTGFIATAGDFFPDRHGEHREVVTGCLKRASSRCLFGPEKHLSGTSPHRGSKTTVDWSLRNRERLGVAGHQLQDSRERPAIYFPRSPECFCEFTLVPWRRTFGAAAEFNLPVLSAGRCPRPDWWNASHKGNRSAREHRERPEIEQGDSCGG